MNPWEMDWSGASPQEGASFAERLMGQSPRVTTYSPQRGGDRMEGGYASSRPGPDGQAMVRTLEDFRTGQAPYVTIAGNPALYGREYTIPKVTYQAGGQRHVLNNVPVVVHDTGGAFRNAPEGRFDVPVGRDMGPADTNQGLSGVQFVPRQGGPMAYTAEQPRPAGVQAIEGAIRPVPGADPIPPRPTAAQARPDTRMPWEMDWPNAAPQTAQQAGPMPWEMDWSTPEAPKAPQQPAPPSGMWNNLTAGLNEAIYGTIGAPVDAATWLYNKAAGQVRGMTGAPVRNIEAPVGGSQWLAGVGEAVGVNDPAKVQAGSMGEKLVRAAGAGAGGMLAPEAVLGGLNRAGVVGEGALNTLGQVFGRSASAGDAAVNAGVGAAAGVGGQMAGQVVPEPWKPLAQTVGGMAGAGVGVGAVAAGRGVAGLPQAWRDFRLSDPATQERVAGERLQQWATDPAAVRDTLDAAAASKQVGLPTEPGAVARNLVKGSEPTTFQLTGDMGLGALERASAAQNPAEFMTRRADQNTARVGALEAIQPKGAPEQVVGVLRQNLAALDQQTGQALEAATTTARQATGRLGGEGAPEAYGGAIRQSIMDARSVAKERERALWQAVDPDGALALPARETARTAAETQATMPASAKPMSGEEAAIFATARRFGEGVAPFSEVAALRSRVSDAMRQEMKDNGQTVQYTRLARLRAAVERDLETAVLDQAEREAQGVASGAVSLEDTMFGRMQAAVGAPGDWPGPTPGATMRAGGASAGGMPGRSDAVMNEAADIALGRKAPYRPPSFLKWIERNGGIRYDDNVATALDAADRRHGNLLNRSGRSVDEWGVSIAERAGWHDRPDQNEILDWIAEAANGREPDWWTALHASPDRHDAARLAEHLTRIAAEEGIPLRSRQAALDLLRRDAELYGLGPTDDLRAWARERAARYGTEAHASEFGASTPGMGRGPGAGASGFSGGSSEWASRLPGSRGQARGQSGRAPGDQGFPGEGLVSSNFDEAALDRLRSASEATKQRAQTFDSGRVGGTIQRSGAAGPFQMEASVVPGRFFVAGPRGFEAMQALRNASPGAMAQVREYAISTLRKAAQSPIDGTLDPAKVQAWRQKHADALRAIPEVDRMLADPVQASETLARLATARKEQMDAFQQGAVARLLNLSDPADVTKTIGGIFSRQDAVQQMARLARETAGNEEARNGLRKAVADYVNLRFVGNTEGAASGTDMMRSDAFQQFLRQNTPALRQVLSGPEIMTLQAIAADLKRSNRSIAAVKLPGGSNTAQDLNGIAKVNSGESWLSRILSPGALASAGAAAGSVAGGGIGAAAGAGGGAQLGRVIQAMRQAGLQSVDQIVTDAMLNPERARALLAQVKGEPTTGQAISLARVYMRAAVAADADAPEDSGTRRQSNAPNPPQAAPAVQRSFGDLIR
ncbi:hypothetical protein GGQ86_004261 [Xanthobacter flavus]|uniref:Uncharacterized protein n=1 Tax=Xanthobacter flavus TaxID=281 RepID=A0A9W6FP19_XANFL|nr:hypothetical protein [Xanthobacter flavus]MDR6335765.1 hypothetical protein [Xanthobacter flavus]GLI24558.1 hypothetical protein XFLAVUS301_42320 [Xanthobacter flavus]